MVYWPPRIEPGAISTLHWSIALPRSASYRPVAPSSGLKRSSVSVVSVVPFLKRAPWKSTPVVPVSATYVPEATV
jgi:hypothetical protein